MLCPTHHLKTHTDSAIRRVCEKIALDRFIVAVDWEENFWADGDYTSIEIIKTIIQKLDKDGIVPNEYRP